jgi:Adenylate and Guanylate cyclase catalytic domain
VLQGEKSRFQLFGDTVNTASRMESTGEKDRIQLSKATADLLVAAGKSSWIKPREDLVHAKGKGFVQTYWLVSRENVDLPQNSDDQERCAIPKRTAPPRSRSGFSSAPTRGVQRTVSDSIHKVVPDNSIQNQKLREERLIQWQVELFARLLAKIVAARGGNPDSINKKGVGRLGGINKISNHSMSRSFDRLSLHDISDDDDGGVFNASKADLPPKGSKRDSFFRLPSRRVSVRKNESSDASRASAWKKEYANASLDVSIDTLASLNEVAGAGENASVITDYNQIQGTQHPAAAVFDGSFDDLNINSIVVDEVAEIIRLPKFSPSAIKAFERADVIQLDDEITSQLRHFIGTVAQLYRCVPKYHSYRPLTVSFSHLSSIGTQEQPVSLFRACLVSGLNECLLRKRRVRDDLTICNLSRCSHVSMATNKFLNRIVIPENVDYERESSDIASDLHTYTFGITSDPLTQFAIVL